MKITITGPRSVGKTTISKIIAEKLNLNYFSSDEIGDNYLKKEGGLDKAIKSRVIGKFIEESAYNLIREIYTKDNFVFDLSGGSISSTKYPKASEKVRETAKSNSFIIGLLPLKYIDESINFLYEREKNRIHFKENNKIELFDKTKKDYIKFPDIFCKLCNSIVYVKDKMPEEIAKEVLENLNKR